MCCTRWAARLLAGLCFCAGLNGCIPGGDSQLDEQKEPHFLLGRKLVEQMDYAGAVDAYERALQINPRSASAHFELALLYEGRGSDDPAAAIYHFQRFLKLCGRSDGRADQAREQIRTCTFELARSVSSLAPMSASAQTSFERLTQENRDLKLQLAQLESAYAASLRANATNPVQNPIPVGAANPIPLRPDAGRTNGPGVATAPVRPTKPDAPTDARTHTVKTNETLAGIARACGVSLKALQDANPRVDARHLRVGSTLAIPAP